MIIATAGFILLAVLALPAWELFKRRRQDAELRRRWKARRMVKA